MPKGSIKIKNKDMFNSAKDKNHDGKITRSEGTEVKGDLNADGRISRSEARAISKAGFKVDFASLP